MATRQLIMPALCSMCGARFSAPVEGIIDVGSNPALKSRFLSGRFNITRCPRCGNETVLNSPLLYHDPEHELALVLMPVELNLNHADQQRIIGDLTNALINSLPPEKRKGYLLTPQTFFTLQSLIDRVLQAEGITPEMIERQRARAKLIETFLQAKDEETLRTLVKQHEAELDYEFFQVLTASAQAVQADGHPEMARALLGLRALLAEMSSSARKAAAEADAAMGLGEMITREELRKRLQEARSDEEFEELVAVGRPLLDYTFFQDLTAQIESAEAKQDTETAARLRALRSRILDTAARQDEELRKAVQEATELLRSVLAAEDPRAFMQQNKERIDDLFLSILSANLQQARADGRSDLVARLQTIGDVASDILEERLPPEIRLIQQLMRAPYPEATGNLLAQNRALVTDQLLAIMENILGQLQAARQTRAAEHLKQVLEQARAIRQIAVQAS